MLKSENIYLRALEPDDLNLLYIWENEINNWTLSGTLIPFSKFTLADYIETSKQDIYTTKQLRLIICLKERDRAIGCIDLFEYDPFNQRAGVGILIAYDADKQQNFGSEALELFIDYCFNTLYLHQLFCNILVDNKASLNLFEKFNFKISGIKKDWIKKRNAFLDEYLLQLINPKQ